MRTHLSCRSVQSGTEDYTLTPVIACVIRVEKTGDLGSKVSGREKG